MKERIISLLKDIRADVNFENCDRLIDNQVLSSLGLLQLISGLSEEFDISIPALEIIPENFNSVDAIAILVERLQNS